MTTSELVQLHRHALTRRYDLRTCNPAHGPFYALMARYRDAVHDSAALRALAAEIDSFHAGARGDQELRAAYGQLAALARWRAADLDATPTQREDAHAV